MSKTILITGATDGIGLLTAELLHKTGHEVLLHGRSQPKLDAAANKLNDLASGDIKTYLCDLSDLAQVRAFAAAVEQVHGSLDVLVNNAGVFKTTNPRTPNGFDVRFVVNTLAPFALTQALLPIIASNGRIINLSSAAQAAVDLAALRGERSLADMDAYAQSKRAITLWSMALAAKNPSGPSFIAVNPGSLLASKMVREGFGVSGNDLHIGADLLVKMSTDPEFADASGRYFDNDSGVYADVPQGQLKDVYHVVKRLTD